MADHAAATFGHGASRPFDLAGDVIHIWAFNWTGWPESVPARMRAWLPGAENREMERYRVAEDRARFCIGRTMARYLSGQYLGLDGRTLERAVNGKGKPCWRDFGDQVQFNVSHSGGWVVIGFSAGRRLGVDVQSIRTNPRFDGLKIAEYAFHPLEIEAVASCAPDRRNVLFHEIWACKEAAVKAAGTGLHGELRKFSVLPVPAPGSWTPIECGNRDIALKDMSVLRLDMDNNHTAALAVAGGAAGLEVHRRELADSGWPGEEI